MANSYSSALVVDTATAASITVLQPKLSSLKAFNTDFSSDVVSGAGLRKLQVAVVGNAAAAVTNPTSFISTGDSVSAAGVTMNHISAQFGLTSAQLNQGFKLEKVLKANLAALGNAIMDVAMTPLTTANFGTAAYNSAITTATGGVLGNDLITKGLPALFSAIANGTERNLVLDGTYFGYLQPQSGFSIPVTGGPAYGFDNVYLNTRFNAVTGGSDALLNGTTKQIRGFAASPEALAMASALPYVDPSVANLMLQQEVVEIPGLDGLQIQLSLYGDLTTRGLYGSFDVLFGAAKADGSALKFITA
jgi:LysM repeat protein